MRVIVAGLGVQGHKRRRFAGPDFVVTVDPFNPEADFRDIADVPLDSYDAVLACIPDEPKVEMLRFCIENGKHVLVEKPLWAPSDEDIVALETAAKARGVVLYTAYNHRFEPHYVRMRDLIASGELGEIYSCRMFYGNGTARLVRDSVWRDQGAGVLPDLGSHLLDTCRFWFGDISDDFKLIGAHAFENRAADHVVIGNEAMRPRIELEMTLLMWRNHFTCDILAEKGTAHIRSLCKWGPSTFTKRMRVLPSGRPPEEEITLVQEDPTWAVEYAHFKRLVEDAATTDLSTALWLHRVLKRLGADAERQTAEQA
ncbi:Gfo/Idh/MocA family oxidoreductase [Aurantimonas sp. MSK8Z-1]|uniref:Gfo/Idh/MocA family protein n=1 Tax=Mangrovibrevibacter kandeliae TaxID=2968473 RepID=UPI0021196EFF|nr:Gfo/Idh/MocA family oxidoreductase [Aurantimonas sp. MSK8Z-1]MCW4117014.1 Gfo/Idh/MocA family oxidoreductase [Aurantimonas sp. MSK8Z-1]